MLSLDGTWDFFPRDSLDGDPAPIEVPGLWEAQGWPELDGAAWYRRRFELTDADGFWSLRFGAVMDQCDVYVNDVHVGGHDGAFTPFELDVTDALRCGENELAVRVVDPPLADPEHARMPHGKQGWNNDAFPSRPSLYLTYGGIWQPVALVRHGPVVVRDVFVNGDPDDLLVELDVCNRARDTQRTSVRVMTLGREHAFGVELDAHERRTLQASFGRVDARPWSPERPVLHECFAGDEVVRFGLRTVRIANRRILLNGEPVRLKAVLVQGFHPERGYAEGTRAEIAEEVRAAADAGFNAVRLHLKAFDPVYLDVCDERGMLACCDLPVGEPVDYAELCAGSTLARRCVAAAREQVRRDRNHPSVVLWSAMNEIGERRIELRSGEAYGSFVDELYDAVEANDGTRPIVENDWIEPMGATVYRSPILTAHWYGRLHRDYFDKVSRKIARWDRDARAFLVSEFGDWGLPLERELAEPPFWDTRARHAAAVADAPWPESLERFAEETQRYQGVSDRLQTEVFRRHGLVAGWCLTELTDVPQELNGILDVHRRPKPRVLQELRRANQRVLPMLDLRSFVVAAGEPVTAALWVANDGPALRDVVVEVAGARVEVAELEAHAPTRVGDVSFAAPPEAGPFEVALRLGEWENGYELRAVTAPPPLDTTGVTVVAEDALTPALDLRAELEDAASVVVLAQPREARHAYPVAVELATLDTRWGSSAFAFTTGQRALTGFPPAAVLAGEDATLHARALVTRIDGRAYPDAPLVARYNPTGNAGTLVGVHRVGRGRLIFCQYRLGRGDLAARRLLADLIALARNPQPNPQGV